MNYPEKYANFFKNILHKEPKDNTEALELIVRHDYMSDDVQKLAFSAKKRIFPLPKIKNVYEKYPEFAHCNGKSEYIKKVNLYAFNISNEVERFNKEQKDPILTTIRNLMAHMMKYIDSYDNSNKDK